MVLSRVGSGLALAALTLMSFLGAGLAIPDHVLLLKLLDVVLAPDSLWLIPVRSGGLASVLTGLPWSLV